MLTLQARAIPIALHGDSVPCTKRMSFDATSWQSLLPTGLSTKDTMNHKINHNINHKIMHKIKHKITHKINPKMNHKITTK